jgi:hypothetical protein
MLEEVLRRGVAVAARQHGVMRRRHCEEIAELTAPGSLASRRAVVVRWSDGTEGEDFRWVEDEVLICAGDHENSGLMSSG